MSNTSCRQSSLITNTSIKEFFHKTVHSAVENQNLDVSDEAVFYLVNLLATFSRSEDLFEHSGDGVELKPLAEIYSRAVSDPSPVERLRLLQRLGDTALFISGLYADSLNRKLVDIDYYIAMGGSAYSSVSDSMRNRYHNEAAQQLFDELTEKFVDCVDVLSEVSENTALTTNSDVLRLYEIWVRTGSKRAAERLRKAGIEPIETVGPSIQH
jgi:hypothetical protein